MIIKEVQQLPPNGITVDEVRSIKEMTAVRVKSPSGTILDGLATPGAAEGLLLVNVMPEPVLIPFDWGRARGEADEMPAGMYTLLELYGHAPAANHAAQMLKAFDWGSLPHGGLNSVVSIVNEALLTKPGARVVRPVLGQANQLYVGNVLLHEDDADSSLTTVLASSNPDFAAALENEVSGAHPENWYEASGTRGVFLLQIDYDETDEPDDDGDERLTARITVKSAMRVDNASAIGAVLSTPGWEWID